MQIGSLQRKLKEHTEHSDMTKKKYADWNAELSRKLQDLRDQKRNWGSETAALRLAEKELRVCSFPFMILSNDLQQSSGTTCCPGKFTGRRRTAGVTIADFHQGDRTQGCAVERLRKTD